MKYQCLFVLFLLLLFLFFFIDHCTVCHLPINGIEIRLGISQFFLHDAHIQLVHAYSGNSQNYWPKSSPPPRDNSFDCSLNRHAITVLLSYIHAHNHNSTEDDNVSIPYHSKIGEQHCFERNTAFCWLNGHWCAWQEWRTAHRSRAWNSSNPEVREQSTVSLRRLFNFFSCNQLKI